jgi:hypothetical protein
MARTYGQWLQMNITSRPLGPRALSCEWRRPSMPGKSKRAAGHPSATGDEVAAMIPPGFRYV